MVCLWECKIIITGKVSSSSSSSSSVSGSSSDSAQLTPSAAATVQVSHALPAVRFSCLLRGCGVSLQDGVAGGKGFLCTPF